MFRIHYIQERRTSQRFDLRWDLSVKGTDERGKNFVEIGTLANLSSFGAFLYLPRQVRVGERLELRIKIPISRDNWMTYTGEVVRLCSVSNSAAVGVKFDTAIPDFVQ